MLKTLIFTLSFYLATFVFSTPQAYAASNIGRIVHSYGAAWVERGSDRIKAKKGELVFRNDTIITSARARVKVVMADGSKVYIGTKSRVSLRRYDMKNKQVITATINMLWGKARFFVNKLVAKNASYRVHTPTAVLGVRGTEFIVSVPPTPELLAKAFEHLKLADMPALPTRTVLMEGAVDVSTSIGKTIRLLPGNTADVNAAKQVNVRKTKANDIDGHKSPTTTSNGHTKNDSKKQNRTKNEHASQTSAQGDDQDIQKDNVLTTPPPPAVSAPKTPRASKSSFEKGENQTKKPPIDLTPTTNAIQNLGNTTDVTIKAGFVKP